MEDEGHSQALMVLPVKVRGAEGRLGFIAELLDRVIFDEVQRVPVLFSALKLKVDRRRLPGRFLLTGSRNVLQTPALSLFGGSHGNRSVKSV